PDDPGVRVKDAPREPHADRMVEEPLRVRAGRQLEQNGVVEEEAFVHEPRVACADGRSPDPRASNTPDPEQESCGEDADQRSADGTARRRAPAPRRDARPGGEHAADRGGQAPVVADDEVPPETTEGRDEPHVASGTGTRTDDTIRTRTLDTRNHASSRTSSDQ